MTTRLRVVIVRVARRSVKPVAVGLLCLLVTLIILDQWVCPLPVDRLQRPQARFVYSREGYLLTAFTSRDHFWRQPVVLDSISPHLVNSLLAIEDRYFNYHPGINPASIAAAAYANVKAGKVVRGGSTITMQIARMIEPKDRTIANKLLEILRAFQLELRYSKRELLEIYFSLAPYGGNIEGVGAAAYFYFEKRPSELTWSEAALLTAIPGSPERFRPDLNPDRALKRRDWVLGVLKRRGVISSEEYRAATGERIPSGRHKVPGLAPHFAQRMQAGYADSTIIRSTIKYVTQVTCERLGQSHIGRLRNHDIHNLAIVVLDNATGELLAMVGSPDFGDGAHGGQINGAVVPRSPGSTLKPFVYALAFDEGLLSPEMRVADVPVNYSGYQPENYDERYHGVVSVTEALVQSYNVPAVNAAAQLGLSRFHRFLKQGGLTTLDRKYYEYGLPLVLGAAEVCLIDLAALYSALGRGGKWLPVKETRDQTTPNGTRILSEGASWLISKILIDLKRPDLPDSWQSTVDQPTVAWKTGTSYGRRDAWAIGFTDRYTVGVWAGNFSGKGSIDLVGAETAAPLMFDIFNNIDRASLTAHTDPPPEIGVRQVCAISGSPAGRFCGETTEESFIIGSSPSGKCNVHRPILVDRNTGLRLTAACAEGTNHDRVVTEIWPPRVASWMVDQGLADPLPVYHTACIETSGGDKPVIVSPESGAIFELVEHIPADYQKITLEVSIPDGDGTVHWFVDGELLLKTRASRQTFYVPEPGRHTLLCVDNQGQAARTEFVVR